MQKKYGSKTQFANYTRPHFQGEKLQWAESKLLADTTSEINLQTNIWLLRIELMEATVVWLSQIVPRGLAQWPKSLGRKSNLSQGPRRGVKRFYLRVSLVHQICKSRPSIWSICWARSWSSAIPL